MKIETLVNYSCYTLFPDVYLLHLQCLTMTMKTFIILASNIKMCVHIIELHRERQVCISDIISY